MKSSSHKCGPCGLKTGWGPALLATAHRGAVHVNVIEGELAQHKICGFHLHLKEGFAALLKSHEKQIEALEKGFGVGLALLHFEWWQEFWILQVPEFQTTFGEAWKAEARALKGQCLEVEAATWFTMGIANTFEQEFEIWRFIKFY